MYSMSHFRQLAHMITVGDICADFIGEFDAHQPTQEVSEQWSIDLCGERGVDPMLQIALVEEDQVIRGWIGYDMLDANKTVADCMERIEPDAIMTSETPIIEATATFCEKEHPFFFVLRGNRLTGWISYSDLHKPPLHLCLFALLLNIERLLLEALCRAPGEALNLLSEERLKQAEHEYRNRGFGHDEKERPFPSSLLDCTTINDKMNVAAKDKRITDSIPSLTRKEFRQEAVRLRNKIAHPKIQEGSSVLLKRTELWPFIVWAENFQSELERFLIESKMTRPS